MKVKTDKTEMYLAIAFGAYVFAEIIILIAKL